MSGEPCWKTFKPAARKRTWLAPLSKKRRADLARRAEVRARVLAPGAICVLSPFLRPGVSAGLCFGPLTPHHLKKEGQGGAYDTKNLVPCCTHHQSWIEDHPNEAHALGLVIRRGDVPKEENDAQP